jgi:hypothetical protein
MGHLLNPVFRSIAPQSNRPKNLPVHGLNVLAFARIQTSLNGGFATRRKGRYAPLSAVACGPALTPLRSEKFIRHRTDSFPHALKKLSHPAAAQRQSQPLSAIKEQPRCFASEEVV